MADSTFSEVTLAIRTLMALVFLTAALGKMRHWAVFQGVVANYRLLPNFLIGPFAYFLPPFEVLLGAALFIGFLSPWAEYAGAATLTAFAVAMGINLRRGRRHIDCGCFQSALSQSLSWKLVIRNGAMVLLLSAASAFHEVSGDLPVQIEGLVAGAVLFMILQSLNILWSIVPAWRRQERLAAESSP